MKPVLPALAIIILSSAASAQAPKSGANTGRSATSPAKPESSVNCLTDWHVGNAHSYTITHDQSQSSPGHKTLKTKSSYRVYMTVIDQTRDDYTVKWQYDIPENERTGRPGLKDSLGIFEGMQFIFKISDVGIFQELVNWEEVRDNMTYLQVLSAPEATDSATAENLLKGLRKTYNTKELVESAMIREIQLFHTPYGYEYSLKPVVENTTLSNPFGGHPLPAIQSTQATAIENNSYTLLLTQAIDKAKAGVPETFQLQDSTRYRFKRPSGWLDKLSFKRVATFKGVTQTDEYFIVMEN